MIQFYKVKVIFLIGCIVSASSCKQDYSYKDMGYDSQWSLDISSSTADVEKDIQRVAIYKEDYNKNNRFLPYKQLMKRPLFLNVTKNEEISSLVEGMRASRFAPGFDAKLKEDIYHVVFLSNGHRKGYIRLIVGNLGRESYFDPWSSSSYYQGNQLFNILKEIKRARCERPN